MTRTVEILAELDAEVTAEKAARAGAPMALLMPSRGGLLSEIEGALVDVALESAANLAVLRRRVAELTATVERLEAVRR